MSGAYGGLRRVQPIPVVGVRARMGDNRETLRNPPYSGAEGDDMHRAVELVRRVFPGAVVIDQEATP
jgi:hypothetical protein